MWREKCYREATCCPCAWGLKIAHSRECRRCSAEASSMPPPAVCVQNAVVFSSPAPKANKGLAVEGV